MLRAIYVRTLNPGVTDEQFVTSWMPPRHTRASYPAAVTVARSVAEPRQVLSIFDVDVDASRFAEVVPELVHPDSEARLEAIVEATQFEGWYEVVDEFGARVTPPPTP
jgi:hypothetical protein